MRKLFLFTASLLCIYGLSHSQNVRSYDGSGNNSGNPTWGMATGEIMRATSNGYGDDISAMGGSTRPNPRLISNLLYDQPNSMPNPLDISDFGWAFGQFMDHDVTFVDDNFNEEIPIPVPAFDPFFDPMGTGTQEILMRRSKSDPNTGTSPSNPRMHVNDITAWIDASNVYGSDTARALWLRSGIDGKLKTSTGDLLPFNTSTGEFTAPIDTTAPFMIIEGPPQPIHFVAGDLRANEQPILTCLHTLFVREHNRKCDELKAANPNLTDEELYQTARKWVGGYIQAITFEEWLPTLGIHVAPYSGYDSNIRPDIMNVFSAAAFRIGHTLINGNLVRLDANGMPHPNGNVSLKDAFFNPQIVRTEGGVEPFFRGMASQRQQTADIKVIGDLRNFLFGPPGAGGLDLVAININRGRERGLVDYNWIREDMGLTKYSSFADITSDVGLQADLLAIYGSIDNIDPWVGMLAEDHHPGAAFGETIHHILEEQFSHLRDGDRFYYENDQDFTSAEIQAIKATRMSDIIKRNTTISDMQDDVFHVEGSTAIDDQLLEAAGITAVQVYPNPVESMFSLRLETERFQEGDLLLTDMMGRTLSTQKVSFTPGLNNLDMQLPASTTSGIYYVTLRVAGAQQSIKIVKR